MNASLKRIARRVALDALPLALLAAGMGTVYAVNATPTLDDLVGTCTYEMRGVVGSPCWTADDPVSDSSSALQDAADIAALTEGLDCWDPSTGRVGSQIVVRDTESGAVSVIPFDEEAFAQASAGAFWVIKACEEK